MGEGLSKLQLIIMYALVSDCGCEVCRAIRKVYGEYLRKVIEGELK